MFAGEPSVACCVVCLPLRDMGDDSLLVFQHFLPILKPNPTLLPLELPFGVRSWRDR